MILESIAAIAFDRSLLKERITFTRMDDNHFDLLFCFRTRFGRILLYVNRRCDLY